MDFPRDFCVSINELAHNLPTRIENFHEPAVVRQRTHHQITTLIPPHPIIPTSCRWNDPDPQTTRALKLIGVDLYSRRDPPILIPISDKEISLPQPRNAPWQFGPSFSTP